MKKQFLILFIMFSLTVHALAILLWLHIDISAVTRNDTVMKIELKTPLEVQKTSATPQAATARSFADNETETGLIHEASVGLENPGGAYGPYLLNIRRRIERLWSYPPQALAENREGSAVISFTIDAGGILTKSSVISSSGSALLDDGALACIKAASPFEPLPASFKLSRLNVTATFSYRINL